jgi:SAM-dependent methyltransferase
MSFLKNITKSYQKLPLSGKVLLFLSLFLILTVFFKTLEEVKKQKYGSSLLTVKEGYAQNDAFLFKTNSQVYDDFYADIYDYLVFNNLKDDYEVGEIINRTTPTSESVILDIGCGTGHHVAKLSDNGLTVLGIDNSPSMIKKAKENYPQYHFLVGDVLKDDEFKPKSFTHILCLYFTIYYIEDKQRFFNHCYEWLKPGGCLIVHLVNRDKFDPILPTANGLFIVSPQKYAKERITKSKVTFNEFVYNADFELASGSNVAKFNEKFKFNDGKVRKQEHTLYMEPQTTIINYAQDAGFIIQGNIDLVHCAYEYQYLYILEKPS